MYNPKCTRIVESKIYISSLLSFPYTLYIYSDIFICFSEHLWVNVFKGVGKSRWVKVEVVMEEEDGDGMKDRVKLELEKEDII